MLPPTGRFHVSQTRCNGLDGDGSGQFGLTPMTHAFSAVGGANPESANFSKVNSSPVPPASSPVPPASSPVPPASSPVPPASSPLPPASSPLPPASSPVP